MFLLWSVRLHAALYPIYWSLIIALMHKLINLLAANPRHIKFRSVALHISDPFLWLSSISDDFRRSLTLVSGCARFYVSWPPSILCFLTTFPSALAGPAWLAQWEDLISPRWNCGTTCDLAQMGPSCLFLCVHVLLSLEKTKKTKKTCLYLLFVI